MPYYRYEALDRTGRNKSGTCEASSVQGVQAQLRSKGLMPYEIRLTSVTDDSSGFSIGQLFERPIDMKTVLVFTKQLGVLLKSGVPLLQAIELLADQFDGRFHRVLIAIKDDLSSGKAFAVALGRHSKIFSSVYVQLVRAGEASGKLENIMQRLHDYIASTQETKQRIKKAMMYPLFMIGFAIVLTIGMLVFLVPMFVEMFDDLKIKPEAVTELLMSASEFLRSNWAYLLAGVIITVIGVYIWQRTASGKKTLDKLVLTLPFTRYFAKTSVVVQFSKTLGMLLASGVNLAEALDIVCNIVDNSVLVETLKGARDNIIKQGKIAYYLEQTKIFPPIASYMIRTGEQSGELSQMLLTVGHDYEVTLIDIIDRSVSKINPIMLVVIGGVVVLMIIGVFLPLFSAMGNIQTLMFQ